VRACGVGDGSPTNAGNASATPIAPAISVAAKTRAQTLMFLPSIADNPY
jgi:hypothetical protein